MSAEISLQDELGCPVRIVLASERAGRRLAGSGDFSRGETLVTRSARERLLDARFYAEEASRIAFGMPPDIFADVSHYHHALRYCILAIGEALRVVPSELQAMAPGIPWRSIIGMRHRLAHD